MDQKDCLKGILMAVILLQNNSLTDNEEQEKNDKLQLILTYRRKGVE